MVTLHHLIWNSDAYTYTLQSLDCNKIQLCSSWYRKWSQSRYSANKRKIIHKCHDTIAPIHRPNQIWQCLRMLQRIGIYEYNGDDGFSSITMIITIYGRPAGSLQFISKSENQSLQKFHQWNYAYDSKLKIRK